MAADVQALLDAGDYAAVAGALLLGTVGAIFVAVLWLRLVRWAFGLFGLGS